VLSTLVGSTSAAAQASPRRAQLVRFECVDADWAEVEVTSSEMFPARNALVELASGQVVVMLSRYPETGDLHSLIFIVSREQLANLSPTEPAVVRYNPSNGQDVWPLDVPLDPATAQGCAAG
jgi:hypothetical protein